MGAQFAKKGLIEACRKKLEEVIGELQEVISDAQTSANDYGPPKDRYDSYRNQLMRRNEMYSQQMQKALEQKKTLDLIDPDQSLDQVEFGAVVVTDRQRLFIAAPVGKVQYAGQRYFVVSPHVPVYKAMQGKKAGEEYVFNNKKDTIREVF